LIFDEVCFTCDEQVDPDELEDIWSKGVGGAQEVDDNQDDGHQHVDERKSEEKLSRHEKG
jgi:hypothetical protein